MKKLVRDGEIVKATISYSNNTYVTERTVYVDDNSKEFVKNNGAFIPLDHYKTNSDFTFHGYWSKI